MSRARHRLTKRRQAEVNKPDDGGDGGTEVTAKVRLYPNEDTYVRDIQIIDGATGPTSQTYFNDFHLHRTALGASSDAILQLGAAARYYMTKDMWGEQEFGDAYELATPAARIFWYTNVSDWGPPGNPNDPTDPGGGTYGLTGGDTIVSATLSLKIHKVWGHHVPFYDGGATYAIADRIYCIYRGTRNANVQGASNGWTAGSMDTMGWYHFKGAPTADAYWGSSGGDSSGATNSADITNASPLGHCWLGVKPFGDGNELPDQPDDDTSNGVTIGPDDDAGRTGDETGVTLDTGGGITTGAMIGIKPSVGGARVRIAGSLGTIPAVPEVKVDVTSLVQDCIDSRTGDLRMVFIGNDDTNTEHVDGQGSLDGYYTHWRHMMEIYSVNDSRVDFRPCIDVTFKRTVPRS